MLPAPSIDRGTLTRWLALARLPEVDVAITDAHRAIAGDIGASRPVCTASGRCCDFGRTGHDLFVTGLEVAWTLDRIPPERAVLSEDVHDARARGDCPFLVGESVRRCGVHPARPMGCRVYFCDPTREGFVQDLAERGAALVRDIHDRFDVPYIYAEWRALLGSFLGVDVGRRPTRPLASERAMSERGAFVALTRGSAS
ncbi:MAG: YkgJ family cysteine cluster protein [Planctomycetota bacterium]